MERDPIKDGRSAAAQPCESSGSSTPDFLNALETALLDSATTGQWFDCGSELPAMAGNANRIRGDRLRYVLLGAAGTSRLHENGVRLRGAWIDGPLELSDATLAVPLELDRCHVALFTLAASQIPRFVARGCLFAVGISADAVACRGDFVLSEGCRSFGTVSMVDARLGGLDFKGGTFDGRGETAVQLNRATVAGSIFLDEGFSAIGDVSLFGADVRGSLRASGAKLKTSGTHALNCGGSTIAGDVDLERADVDGLVSFAAADCGASLWMTGIAVRRPGLAAISLIRLKLRGNLDLDGSIRVQGAILAAGAAIGGYLDLSGATLENADKVALDCSRASIDASIVADDMNVRGDCHLLGCEIGGDLSFKGATLVGREVAALYLSAAKIRGHLFLSGNFNVTGLIAMIGTTIDGRLFASGGTFAAGSHEYALIGDSATVNGDAFFEDGCSFDGPIRMNRANFQSTFSFVGATLISKFKPAFQASDLQVTGSLLFATSDVRGAISMQSAHVGSMDLARGKFVNPSGDALELENLRVAGGLFFRKIEQLQGRVNLSGGTVGSLVDDLRSWLLARGDLVLDGFTYGTIAGTPTFTDAVGRIAWLQAQDPIYLAAEFRPQPWEQLIRTLRSMGHPNAARSVAVAKQRAERKAGRIRGLGAVFHMLYGVLIGYGYRPIRLVSIMFFLWLASAGAIEAVQLRDTDPLMVATAENKAARRRST